MGMKIFLLILLVPGAVFAASLRTIDGDFLRSSDTTKTWTPPAATDTIVGRASTDTLTNKTISGADNTLQQLPVASELRQETPSGTVNGSNVTFTLSVTPASTTAVQVFLNGLLQLQGGGLDYTISGSTITFVTAPATGQTIRAVYPRY